MSSKETIMAALRSAGAQAYEKPDLSALRQGSIHYEDKLEQFRAAVTASGGKVADYEGADLETLFSGEKDLVVVEGVFGVAENGCVWLNEPVGRPRVDYFIHEALAIVLDRNEIVDNMHEAYARLGEKNEGYGIFISGPSKTADIEQSLVFGAHGSRMVAILLK